MKNRSKMKRYPNEKYTYTVQDNVVTAHSSYAGKPVCGTAKCDPRDEFDFEAGKGLAAARCNFKIATKRKVRAENKMARLRKEMDVLLTEINEAAVYVHDANLDYEETGAVLRELEEKMI